MVDSKTRQSSPRRKWVGLLFVILLIAGGCWLGHYCWLRLTLEPQPRDQYWAEKIDALDPAPPGATPYSTIETLIQSNPWLDSSKRNSLPGCPIFSASPLRGKWDRSRPNINAMCHLYETEEFARFRDEIISTTEKGWKKPYEPDDVLSNVPMEHLAIILTTHSRWALENEDWNTAMQDWITTLLIGRQLRRQHLISGIALESNIQSIVASELIEASRSSKPIPSIHPLVSLLDSIFDDDPLSQEYMKGQYYHACSQMDQCYVRNGKGWLDIPAALEQNHHSSTLFGLPPVSRAWNLLSFVYHTHDEAMEKTDKIFTSGFNCSTLIDFTTFRDVHPLEELNILDGQLLHEDWENVNLEHENLYVQMLTRKACLSRMKLQAGITMLAIRIFQQDHDRLPDSLDELAADYCPVPLDYWDGKPLKYRITNNGYSLYSISEDGIDDQGKCTWTNDCCTPPFPDRNYTTWQRAEADPEIDIVYE